MPKENHFAILAGNESCLDSFNLIIRGEYHGQ